MSIKTDALIDAFFLGFMCGITAIMGLFAYFIGVI
jgi:hypothetical protein